MLVCVSFLHPKSLGVTQRAHDGCLHGLTDRRQEADTEFEDLLLSVWRVTLSHISR